MQASAQSVLLLRKSWSQHISVCWVAQEVSRQQASLTHDIISELFHMTWQAAFHQGGVTDMDSHSVV